MTPEERFLEDMNSVLEDIQSERLLLPDNSLIRLQKPNAVGVGITPWETQKKLLLKLESVLALKIIKGIDDDFYINGYQYIEIKLLPKFDEIYNSYIKPDYLTSPTPVKTPNIPNNTEHIIESLKTKRIFLKDLSDKNFFLELGEFMEYIQKLPVFPMIEEILTLQKETDERKILDLEKKLKEDTEKVKNFLVEELKRRKLPLSVLNDDFFNKIHGGNYNNALELFDATKENKIYISGNPAENLYSQVGFMINGLNQNGHKDIIKNICNFHISDDGVEYVTGWKISKYFEDFKEETVIFKNKAAASIWEAYQYLVLVPFALYHYQDERTKLIKQFEQREPVFWRIVDLDTLIVEMKEIVTENREKKIIFRREAFELYITKFVTFIIDFLRLQETKAIHSEPNIASIIKNANVMDTKMSDKNKQNFYGSAKLEFYPNDGLAIYRGVSKQFTGKALAFLLLLYESKNTPFSLDDLKSRCNPNINVKSRHFKGDKDARDNLNYIKDALEVKKGDYFPIGKVNANWIWRDK